MTRASSQAVVEHQSAGMVSWISADGDDLWFVESVSGAGALRSVLWRLGPGGAERVEELPGVVSAPAPDPRHVFFTFDHSVVRIARATPSALETIASAQVWPIHVVVQGDAIFWSNQSTENLDGGNGPGSPGNVTRAARDGTGATVLTREDARELAVDAANVYFSSATSIRAVDRNGGSSRVLVTDAGLSPALSLDGDWLYFTRTAGISRVHTPTGAIEPVAEGIEIPLFVAARVGWVWIGANAVFRRPGEMSPARVIRVGPDRRGTVVWEAPLRLAGLALGRTVLHIAAEPFDGSGGTSLIRVPIAP